MSHTEPVYSLSQVMQHPRLAPQRRTHNHKSKTDHQGIIHLHQLVNIGLGSEGVLVLKDKFQHVLEILVFERLAELGAGKKILHNSLENSLVLANKFGHIRVHKGFYKDRSVWETAVLLFQLRSHAEHTVDRAHAEVGVALLGKLFAGKFEDQREFTSTRITRVHGDEYRALRIEHDLFVFELEGSVRLSAHQSSLDLQNLGGNDRKHF